MAVGARADQVGHPIITAVADFPLMMNFGRHAQATIETYLASATVAL
jgi:hypothetical protein